MDEAAAKRAAAAEARRQKILARGTQRLNRITLGAPLASEEPATAPEQEPTEAPTEAPADGATVPQPVAASPPQDAQASAEALVQAPIMEAPAATVGATSLGATAEDAGPDVSGLETEAGAAGQQTNADEAAAQREAEQAFHALLNQLAGAAGPFQQQGLQLPDLGLGPSASGATAYGSQAQVRPRGGPAGPSPRRGGAAATVALAPPALPPVLAALLAAVAAVAAVVAPLLGPQLSAAVDATRRVRCCVALLMSALLHSGLMGAGGLLRVPPVLALLLTQVALIAGARLLVARNPSRLRLSKSLSGLNLAGDANGGGGGAVDGDEDAAASTAAPSPLPRFDWLSFAPGLRPLINSAASVVALLSGLAGDVSVFLVAYVVLGAGSELAGARAAAR